MKKAFLILCGLCLFGCERPQQEIPSTATEQVRVLEPWFVIPEVERPRQLRVYLPPGYENNEQRYPVIYMHDAQNLFDNATAYAGEWAVDETLNRLAMSDNLHVIVVGIDNGGDFRMNELSPWTNLEFGEAQGEAYLTFITEVVKPYIDNRFRTKSEARNTAIIGSSMGGLMSHYAALAKPDVFGKAGILSPSYWYSGDVFGYTSTVEIPSTSKFFVSVGGLEGTSMAPDVERMQGLLRSRGMAAENLFTRVVEDGEHNEAFWTVEFEHAVKWLFNEE